MTALTRPALRSFAMFVPGAVLTGSWDLAQLSPSSWHYGHGQCQWNHRHHNSRYIVVVMRGDSVFQVAALRMIQGERITKLKATPCYFHSLDTALLVPWKGELSKSGRA